MNTEHLNQTRETSAPLFEARRWMKLLGGIALLMGFWLILSIAGILIAWLPIWLGALLFQSARAAERAHLHGDQESLIRALQKLKTCFAVTGGIFLLVLVVVIVFTLALVAGSLSGTHLLPT